MAPETPTQEVETWPAHVCDVHGLLQRSQTRLGFRESIGGRLECNFCPIEEPPRFVTELQVIALEDHQRLLRAVEEERDKAELLAADKNKDWEEAARLAIQRKRVIEEAEDELERRRDRGEAVTRGGNRDHWFLGNAYGLGEALRLLRDKGTEQAGVNKAGPEQQVVNKSGENLNSGHQGKQPQEVLEGEG